MTLISISYKGKKYSFFTKSEITIGLIEEFLEKYYGIIIERGETLTFG